MRTSRLAGLVAGALCLYASQSWAAEGSSLRGLRPPGSDFDGPLVQALVGSGLGLKVARDESLANVAARDWLGATVAARRITNADTDFRLALSQPIGQNIAALAEPGINSLYEVLPRYTLHTSVTQSLAGGWGLGLGVRQTEYNFGTANLLSLSAERSWGNLRSAYTLYSNRAEGAGLGSTHRFEVSYLYGERNVIGFSYTTGRDLDTPGLLPGLSVGDVRDWTLSGRHWLSPNWALTYDLLGHEQVYRRPGLRFGVSRSF
jgi:YaiO family outer membrane protein